MRREKQFLERFFRVIIIITLMFGVQLPAKAQLLDSLSLDELVVTGVRHETDSRHMPSTITSLSRETLDKHYRSSILSTLNEHVPGLFSTSRGVLGYGVSNGAAGMFSLRGVGGNNPNAGVLILVDGVPQYAGLYGHGIADACQTMIAERVEVLHGPASLIYGSNAMGGVVNIVTRKVPYDGFKTNMRLSAASYGTIQAEAATRYRYNKFSSTVGLSYARTDGHRADSKFGQYTGFLKMGYEFSPHWQLDGNVNIIHFDASNPGEVDNPLIDNDQEITRGTSTISLINRYEEHLTGALRIYYNWGHHRVNDGYHVGENPKTTYYLHDDIMAGISLYETASIFPGNHTTVGFDWTHFGGNAWNEPMNGQPNIPIADRTEDELAAYVDVQQQVANTLSLHAGIRIDHHTQSGTQLVPQAGAALMLPHDIQLKISVGKGFRNPTIKEMYMFPPQNADLKPEHLANYELAYKQKLLDGKLRWGVNLFYLKGEDLIMTIPYEGRKRNVNIGKVENSGAELVATYLHNDRWTLNTNYSFLHMEHPVVGAPEHKLYVGGHYRQGCIGVATGIQYIAGLYTIVEKGGEKENFLLWNLTADMRLSKWASFFIKGENLLAQRYEINAGYPMPKVTLTAGMSFDF